MTLRHLRELAMETFGSDSVGACGVVLVGEVSEKPVRSVRGNLRQPLAASTIPADALYATDVVLLPLDVETILRGGSAAKIGPAAIESIGVLVINLRNLRETPPFPKKRVQMNALAIDAPLRMDRSAMGAYDGIPVVFSDQVGVNFIDHGYQPARQRDNHRSWKRRMRTQGPDSRAPVCPKRPERLASPRLIVMANAETFGHCPSVAIRERADHRLTIASRPI